MKHQLVLSALVVAVAGGSGALAATNGFYVPNFRGQSGTTAGYWESFTVGIGAPGNKANFGNDSTSTLTQTAEGAIVVGSGNIYNQPIASAFVLSYSGSGSLGTVVLQTRTSGTELDYGSVSLNYGSGILSANRTELDRSVFGAPGQGFSVSSAWQWDLSSYNVSSFTIDFKAAGPSLSFDSATLDTQVVPEPQTWALAGLGLGALGLIQWRRSRR